MRLQKASIPYEEKIRNMMEQGDTRLLVDIGELRDHNAMLAQNVLDNPAAWLPSFDKALAEKVADLNPEYGREN